MYGVLDVECYFGVVMCLFVGIVDDVGGWVFVVFFELGYVEFGFLCVFECLVVFGVGEYDDFVFVFL